MARPYHLITLLFSIFLFASCSNSGRNPVIIYTPTEIPGLTYSGKHGQSFYSFKHPSGAYLEYHVIVERFETNIHFVAKIPENVTASFSKNYITTSKGATLIPHHFVQTARVDFEQNNKEQKPYPIRVQWNADEKMIGNSYSFTHPHQTRMYQGSVCIKTDEPEKLSFKLPGITINGASHDFAEFKVNKSINSVYAADIRFQR